MLRLFLLVFLTLACVSTHASNDKCQRFVLAFSGFLQQNDFRWESSILTPEPVTTLRRMADIYFQMHDYKNPLQDEVREFLASRSDYEVDLMRTALIDLFNVIDPDYQYLLATTERSLQGRRRVAELGCGAGMICAMLNFEALDRHVIAVDKDSFRLDLVPQRMQYIPPAGSTIELRNQAFADLQIAPQSLNGAVLSLVLFHLPYVEKVALLQQVHGWLQDGAPLVLNDFVTSIRWDPTDRQMERYASVVSEGHRLSEFQFALHIAISTGLFSERFDREGSSFTMHTLFPGELRDLLRNLGFIPSEPEMIGHSGITTITAHKRAATQQP